MKPTPFALGKLKWMLSQSAFKRKPLTVAWRMLAWEILRTINRPLQYQYDEQFRIILRPNEGASRLTYYFGVSEPQLFEFYNCFLREGMVVVDAGANIGLHTLYFAKRVGKHGKVYAFEPDPSIFKRLKDHLDSNRVTNVIAINCALGSQEGEVSVVGNAADTSRTYVTRTSSVEPEQTAEVVRLDRILSTNSIDTVHFAKVDVEGFEYELLVGSDDYLQNQLIDVLQVELDQRSLDRANGSIETVTALLDARGYQRARWDPARGVFERSSQDEYNTFFVSDRYRQLSS
jgi:FkbM family methyltransferase